ncbi:abortive infection family protein [Bradyrhizobium quebecense]|uniref:Abortive infection family protein n=1 Tax=Bradyrhizobium quebecense TaxID=2748629 RepID=A0A974ACU4_9BRAD|nr:abortive infection family protein [Bradyrhizobium quebecense]UGA41212.1 abortive infection family protein [Bradyrhizobium quebecense]
MADAPALERKPLSTLVDQRLAHSRYDAVYADWVKSIDRLDEDRDGALTAARAMLETLCKTALNELDVSYDDTWDLPKLYYAVASNLGISPTQHTDSLFKSVFGASQTIVARVGEMRNKLGDAHGKANLNRAVPRHHAELAVNLAGSICCFVISCLESAVAAKKLRTANGDVILKFEVATVWRLVDHARNAPISMPWYGRTRPKRALWLVGDAGIYLMSNGQPAMDQKGNLIKKKKSVGVQRLVAPALGCDPTCNSFEDWWPLHGAIDNGSDFSIAIAIKAFESILPACKSQIVIILNPKEYRLLSDVQLLKL